MNELVSPIYLNTKTDQLGVKDRDWINVSTSKNTDPTYYSRSVDLSTYNGFNFMKRDTNSLNKYKWTESLEQLTDAFHYNRKGKAIGYTQKNDSDNLISKGILDSTPIKKVVTRS